MKVRRMYSKRATPAIIYPACRALAAGILLFLIVVVSCSDSPTEPQSPPSQASILLSRLVVSVVPGGSETITVYATNPDGSPSNCTISISSYRGSCHCRPAFLLTGRVVWP